MHHLLVGLNEPNFREHFFVHNIDISSIGGADHFEGAFYRKSNEQYMESPMILHFHILCHGGIEPIDEINATLIKPAVSLKTVESVIIDELLRYDVFDEGIRTEMVHNMLTLLMKQTCNSLSTMWKDNYGYKLVSEYIDTYGIDELVKRLLTEDVEVPHQIIDDIFGLAGVEKDVLYRTEVVETFSKIAVPNNAHYYKIQGRSKYYDGLYNIIRPFM